MAVPDPDHLFEQADRLLAPPPPETEARPTDLRRAISAAYYAVFHFTLTAGADLFVGAPKRSNEQYRMTYRSVTHEWLRNLCDQIRGRRVSKVAPHAPSVDFFGDIVKFANTVAELQELRHSADYDPTFSTTPDEVKILIAQARQAVTLFRAATEVQRVAFLTLLFFDIRKLAQP